MTATASGRATPGRRLLFPLAALAALVLTVAAYSNHFSNGFHFDDAHVIVGNMSIRSLAHWPRFFTEAETYTARPQNATYRPLLTLSYALDFRTGGGLDSRAFHATQFALFLLLCSGLVALYTRLARTVGSKVHTARWIALFAAAWFAVHVANTQTVNYLSARSTLVATLGVVFGLLIWIGWPRGRPSGLYLLPVVLGCLAKPEAVMFAPILAAWILLFEEGSDRIGSGEARRAALRALPAFVVCLGCYLLVRAMEPPSLDYSDLDRWTYARSQPFAWLHYLRLFVWPQGLTADTDWQPLASWWDWRFFAGTAFIFALAAAALVLARSKRLKPAAFGLAWFALGLLPTSSLFPLSEIYNEHRLFLPFAGLTFAAVWLLAEALGPRIRTSRAARVVVTLSAVALLVAHAVATHRRNEVWRDDLSLWSDVVRKSPEQGRGHMNLGLAYLARGRTAEALELFEHARTLAPDYAILETNLGLATAALDRHPEAEAHFARALQLDPAFAVGRVEYARWLSKRGRGEEAMPQLEEAVRLAPNNIEARTRLLQLLAVCRDPRLAAVAAQTLEIDPRDATALTLTGALEVTGVAETTAAGFAQEGRRQMERGLWIEGALLTRRSLDLDGSSAIAWNQLGWAQAQLGFWSDAAASFRRALEADPQMELARHNLAWAEEHIASTKKP